MRYWIGKSPLADGSRIGEEERKAIIEQAGKYVRSTPDKQYRKDPGRWLYNRGWEDEIISGQASNANTLPRLNGGSDDSE